MVSLTGVKKFRLRKTAFVLSGGGRLGSVQVGMLKALFEHGVAPDLCVGTSVGAINAAYLCGNPTMSGITDLERIWLSVNQKDILPVGLIRSVLQILRGKNYLISQNGLRTLLEEHIHYTTFTDAAIPCLIMATDILTGEQIVLTKGNIIDAVLASTALPGIYEPVSMNGRILMDGGISSNTPLSAAVEYGATEIYFFPAGYPRVLIKTPDTRLRMLMHSLNILIGQQFLRDIEIYQNEIPIYIIPPVILNQKLPNNLSRTAELLKLSYKNTKQWIDSGEIDKFKIPGRLLIQNQWL